MFEITSEFVPALYPRFEYLGSASQFVDSVFERVDHVPIFWGLSFDEIRSLASHMKCFAAPANVELIQEGDSADFLLLVMTGRVAISTRISDVNESRSLGLAEPGSTLGEISLFDEGKRLASCRTATPTDFAMLHRCDLDQIQNEDPYLMNRLLRALLRIASTHVRELHEANLSRHTVRHVA